MSMQKPSKVKPKTPKRSTTKHPVEEPEAEPVISHGVNLYHLGTEIGRGGFAVVFQAFNATTGQTVAVKRFPLSAIAGKESQLSVQLAEIELMHELDHPNIVKYYDTVKTKSFLYIVLEYMENGSLVNLIKKFGCFSETLTAIYVMQVLSGLKYLHDQGVLHRDIKGANILTSKDGMVKLADFGVAMKMADVGGGPSAGGNGLEDNPDLAGSPYWMAPEIIEMSTPTSACDIWSVGCVVIELLTSKPPYYDMDPMSALFRIVSDDYPPFPEGISQAAKDFLLQCFHKEPSMRSSAAELLSHPWLSNSSSRQSLVQTSQMLQSRSMDAQDTSVGQSTEVIQSAVRMYERNLQTIPEAENEFIDTDRSRVTADSHHPLQTSGMSARTSARDKDSARDSTSTGRSSARESTNTGRSSARYSARSENSADSVVPVEVKPISALQEEEPNWHSVLLTGSTSLPGSADSRSRSHSGDEASRPSGSYDSNFAISAESGRSSSLISQQSGRAPAATTTPTATAAAFLQPTARDSSFDFENTHVLASPQKLSGEENSPSSAPAATGTHAHTTTTTATSDVNMEETITPPPAGTAETVISPRSGRTLSARSGSLQGMKIISDDSMDETNWDIDFTVSASRDSMEETGAASIMPRRHLLRNALGVAQQHSPGRSNRGSHPSNAPFLINLNAQSLSFTGSKPVDPPIAVPTTTTTNTTSAAAADTSPGFDSEEDDFLHEHTVPPPAAEHVRRMQIPQIKIPTLTLPRPPASSLYKLSNNHSQHSSLDLVKYQDNPEDDDFAEFDTMSQLSTPRGNNNKTKAITNKFSTSNRSISSAPSPGHPSPTLKHTQYINAHSDDDFESDFALDGTGFDDKIKAFKTNSRQSSISILDAGEGEGGGGSNNNEKNNIFTTGNTTSSNIITSPSSSGLLANQLRKKIQQQQQQVATKDNTDEDLDAFINYQYDEKDFKQNETKDLHFRRSREIVEIMNLIRQEVKVKEIVDLCNQLLMIFSDIPEQRDHLITHHGVMPIVDMFDTRCSSSTFRSGAHTSRSTKALYVLKVVNKIIEGNVKAKEQLSLVGIIPTVMNLFDNSFRHAVYHPHVPQVVYSNINHTATGSSSTSTDSVGEIAHQLPGITLTDPRPPLAPHIAMRDDIDPVTLEAARFIHQICSTSSLTLQMLIGAGGLSVLTSMVSLGSILSPALFSPHAMNTAAAGGSGGLNVSSVTTPQLNTNMNHNNVLNNTPWMSNPNAIASSAVTLQRSASGSSSPLTDARAAASTTAATSTVASSHGIATLAAFSNDLNDVAPVTDQQLADDVFFNPKSSFTAANIGADSEEILNRMSVFQMGVDCVAEVFSMKASRSRDFCRLFVKLGLLQPLALSFQNILAMFRARQLNSTNTSLVIPPNTTATIGGTVGVGGGVSMSGVATAGGDTATTSSTNATPRESFRSTSNTTTTIPNPPSVSNQHRRDSSGLSQSSPRGSVLSLPSPRQTTIREDSLASSHTGSFYLFSSQQEAEESAECKYALRMATLFFTFSRSDAIVAETMVKAEHCVLHVLLTALQAPELRSSGTCAGGGRTTPSGTNQHSNKTELVLSAASLSAHNAGTTTSPSLLRRTHVHLLPTYTEIMDLLLKCLKNLSMEPSALADLEAAGTLETLVPLLSGPMSDRYRNHILPCIFNMCRINKRRQERVAALGIIPHLKKVITDNSPLRQFALPILFDLAHTCDTTRRELGKWNCQAFFLDLLKENYWQAFALNSLAVWLTSDPSSVVSLLIEPAHLAKLIEFFKSAHSQTIHTLHRPLLDMMLKSSELCKALGKISLFTNILIKRLRYTDEAIVLRSLLKMLQLLYEFHENSKIWVESNNLIALVEEFAKTERKVLVRQLARKLLIDFTQSDT